MAYAGTVTMSVKELDRLEVLGRVGRATTDAAARAYLERYGKPVAFYSDKASIFRVTASEAKKTPGITQFDRALSELNVDILCANTLTVEDGEAMTFTIAPASDYEIRPTFLRASIRPPPI